MSIKECPFCGSPAPQDISTVAQVMFHVYCPDCLCTGPVGTDEVEAEKRWNTRVGEED